MSFLKFVDMDPHIHLFAIKKLNAPETQQSIKQKIHFLLKTRKFDQIAQQAGKLQGLTFPTLSQSLKKAKVQTQQQIKALNLQNVDKLLKQLQQLSQLQDPDYDYIDSCHEKILALAKIIYDQGKYQQAYQLIKKLQMQYLAEQIDLKCTWARLYCQYLLSNPLASTKTIMRLRKKLDQAQKKDKADKKNMNFNKTVKQSQKSLARRIQFLNIVVLVCFNNTIEGSLQKLVDILSEQDNFSIVCGNGGYLSNYFAVALILSRSSSKTRRFDLSNLIQALRRNILDTQSQLPILEIIKQISIDFEFQQGLKKISEVKSVSKNDYLMKQVSEQLTDALYFLYYKTFLNINEQLSLQQVSKSTSKTVQQAQLWILKHIRSYQLQARIDSIKGLVVSVRGQQSQKYGQLVPKISTLVSTLATQLARQA